MKISQIRNTVYLSPEDKRAIGEEALNPIVELDRGGNADQWGEVRLKLFTEEKIQISCSVLARLSKGAKLNSFTTTITIPKKDLQEVLSKLNLLGESIDQRMEA